MTEATLHAWMTAGLFGLGAATALVLAFISAPYGRHARGGWGPRVPRHIAWVTMESPAVLGFALIFALGAHRMEAAPLALLAAWQAHYVHRTFVYPFRSAGTPWPLSLVIVAFLFQSYNGYLNARWISHFGDYPTSWLVDPRFLIGIGLFALGLALNLWADGKLQRLRGPGEEGYQVPRGGAFELVSCPNYLGEILEWLGWAIATWSLPGAAFAAYTIANLGPRAQSHHRWYRERFADYPAKRKALVPFVW